MTFKEANENYFHRFELTEERARQAFGLEFFEPLCHTCDHSTECHAYTHNEKEIKICNFFERLSNG